MTTVVGSVQELWQFPVKSMGGTRYDAVTLTEQGVLGDRAYAVIDVETEDRVGLLYALSQTLSELRIDISVAKISTEKGAAMDSFGYASGLLPGATPRGIGTLPGGIPITRTVPGSAFPQVIGGIGVFFPGKTGFATESNCSLSSNYNPSKQIGRAHV